MNLAKRKLAVDFTFDRFRRWLCGVADVDTTSIVLHLGNSRRVYLKPRNMRSSHIEDQYISWFVLYPTGI